MNWRELPAWLKGGILGIIITILVIILLIFFGGNYYYTSDQVVPRWTLMLTYPTEIFKDIFPIPYNIADGYLFNFINIIFLIIFYFLPGALIGWIIGKIKSKK